MTPMLRKVNKPTGRMDVLLYRLTERLVQEHCPAAWPMMDRSVARWCSKHFGPNRNRKRRSVR